MKWSGESLVLAKNPFPKFNHENAGSKYLTNLLYRQTFEIVRLAFS